MTNPTHHPASTTRSHGNRFPSLLQKHHRIRQLTRNIQNREKNNKAPALLLDWETLWMLHSRYRGDDTKKERLDRLWYRSLVTAQMWIHPDSSTPPQLLNSAESQKHSFLHLVCTLEQQCLSSILMSECLGFKMFTWLFLKIWCASFWEFFTYTP